MYNIVWVKAAFTRTWILGIGDNKTECNKVKQSWGTWPLTVMHSVHFLLHLFNCFLTTITILKLGGEVSYIWSGIQNIFPFKQFNAKQPPWRGLEFFEKQSAHLMKRQQRQNWNKKFKSTRSLTWNISILPKQNGKIINSAK